MIVANRLKYSTIVKNPVYQAIIINQNDKPGADFASFKDDGAITESFFR